MERNESLKHIALAFNKTHTTIYTWIKRGCPVDKITVGLKKEYRFNLKEVEEWVKKVVG